MSLLKKLLFPIILLLLAYAFWQNSNFKQIAAGVAIFLFGMLALEDGFQQLSGGMLERFLRTSTNRLWKSFNFGLITTTLMQSSSLVSILTISFLSAGLIELAGGIGIIFGANIGTTTGAWLLAGFGLKVKLSAYSMPMLIFGIIFIFQKSKVLKAIGWVLAGVGFLFLGIHNMKEGFDVMRETIDLSAYSMTGFKGLIIYSLIGVAATVIMQSSHATLVLIITALATSQITYENALALSIGANVGTTITAILGSLSANIEGKRLAAAHLIFNFITATIAMLSIKYLLIAVEWIGDHMHLAPDNYTLRLAIFHTLFNVIGVIAVMPFIKPLVKFLKKFMPDKAIRLKQPKYILESVLESEHATKVAIYSESVRLFDLSQKVIANGIALKKSELIKTIDKETLPLKDKPLEGISINEAYEIRIKQVFSSIFEFVIIAREKFSGNSNKSIQKYSIAVRRLAFCIKEIKHLNKNLVKYIQSDNLVIKGGYNYLRWSIIETVRQINTIRHKKNKGKRKHLLNDLSEKVINDNTIMIEKIENAISNHSITALMSTSLVTDTEYANRACQNLIEMAEILFIGQKYNNPNEFK
jgi:phosphate:Na+ symporter